MKKNLLIALFALCAYSLYADGLVVTLDSIMTRDVYNDLWKSEKYTYDEKQQVVKYIKWDNTGSSLKQDSTFYHYDAQGNMIFREKWAYPRTSKYPGWKGSSREENEYSADGKLYKEKSWSYFQPNADTEGEWYANSGYTYTYYDNGSIHTKLMASGGYRDGTVQPYTDKLMYVYTYDDQGRVILEETFDKSASEEWTEKSSRKTFEYSNDRLEDASLELYENYENGEWIPSSKTIRAFDDSDNLTLIEYWSYDETLKKWEGSSKIEYTLNTKGDILGYLDYGWENDNWMASKKSENQFDDNGNKILTHSWLIEDEGSLKDFTETEYGYDDQGRQNMSAYYTYSNGSKKGSLKSEYVFNDKDQEIEKTTYQWSTFDNNWEGKKKETTTYNENDDIASIKEDAFDGFEYMDKYVHTYYYTVHNTGGISEAKSDTMNFKVMVQTGTIQVEVSDDSPVSFYDLNGKLIKSNSTICSSLSAGVYVVKVGVNAVKVMVP